VSDPAVLHRPLPDSGFSSRSLQVAAALGVLVALALSFGAQAQPGNAKGASTRNAAPVEEGVRWQRLKPAQREALKPLQQEWSQIDAPRKQKWIELADRLPGMPPEERARVQGRMADWTRLTPAERGQARLRYQETRQLPLGDRRSRWEAYQALSPEEKSQLAARAAAERGQNGVASRRGAGSARLDRRGPETPQPKSNIVGNPSYATGPRAVGPTTIQAAPGATTTFITRRPSPPRHEHTGLPKVAATPEFVDRSTLLPQRGPQGAAVRAVPPREPRPAGQR
jgi:hypothetical protein